MADRKNNENRFVAAFVDYFCRKKPNGRREYKQDEGYVKSLGRDYYRDAKNYVTPQDYQDFFLWLAREEPYFADDHVFRNRAKSWNYERTKVKKEGLLPIEFLEFIRTYGFLAEQAHLNRARGKTDCKFRKIGMLTLNLESLPEHRDKFIGLSVQECYKEFYSWLHSYGITNNEINIMEQEQVKFRDACSRAKGERSVKALTADIGNNI